MSMPGKIDGVVVGGVDFGEADRIVRILGPDGRFSAFAHGARKSRRRFAGALQPFTSIRAELGRARAAGVPTLVSVEVVRARLSLSADLGRLALASYACELSERLAPEGAATDLVSRLTRLLDDLLAADASPAKRRAFELGLLDELGYRPEVGACVQCGGAAPYLDLPRGGTFCAAHRAGGREIGPKTRAWVVASLEDPGSLGGLSLAEADRAARAVGPSVDAALAGLLERRLASLPLVLELGL